MQTKTNLKPQPAAEISYAVQECDASKASLFPLAGQII